VWQPIETLPEPGEDSTVFVIGAEKRRDGSYAVGEMHWTSDGWYWAGNDPTDSWGGRIDPEYWQPLPEPPLPERTA
jgi:hypothetical protein